MATLNSVLFQIANQDIFISTEPDVLDFTNDRPGKLFVSSKQTDIEIPLSTEQQKLSERSAYLEEFLGGKTNIIITWNLKNLLTFVKGRTGKEFSIKGQVFELSFLESYHGINQPKPKNFAEAWNRLTNLIKRPNWKQIYEIYKKIFLPLIYNLSKLETTELIHKTKKIKIYSHYELDGQINGRLKTAKLFKNSYNPHGLLIEDKENLCPFGWDYHFMLFDYKHMEVSVLQWLTKDEYLTKVLNSGEDFYSAIWDSLIPIKCDENHRKTCKEFFLPIVYGLGTETLAERIKWPVEQARNLIDKTYKLIPTAMNWIRKQQVNMTADGWATDHYGRLRNFDNNYKIRNFSIQSPASLICLDKLNKLMVKFNTNKSRVAMHIHDGYIFTTKQKELKSTFETAKNILESEDVLYPGLKLKVGCSTGVRLSDLSKLNDFKEADVSW